MNDKEHKSKLHLFEAYGVELEYMIVDQHTLDVKPIADVLLKNSSGEVEGEIEHGLTAWSNELVSHVIEMKSNGPTADLSALGRKFHQDVLSINNRLKDAGAQLLSSATHPWMNPAVETRLWQHDSNEIYHAYDRIFNCKGHGWSNLQSVHINLPFYDDEEFARLHTAIRFIMPLIPALTASSPILDGKVTSYLDKRLYYYEKNQSNIPILTGKVIPEKLFSKHSYQKHVYDRIAAAIKPHDPDGILKPMWLNSRGAMARFDRGAIEIRIIDIQECPAADMAIVVLLVHLLKILTRGKWVSFEMQQSFETDDLYAIYRDCVKLASGAQVVNTSYLKALGYQQPVTGKDLWHDLIQMVHHQFPDELAPYIDTLMSINSKGTLAERILAQLGTEFTREDLLQEYRKLGNCLASNTLFAV